jgi:hypothetical protein
MKHILGFGVGASLTKGHFVCLLLKFKLTGEEMLLTSWNQSMCVLLVQALTEYMQHLGGIGVDFNGDEITEAIKKNEPVLTDDETQAPPINSIVTDIKALVKKNNDMVITIHFYGAEQVSEIILSPKYSEWLLGYIGNTLDEFDETGDILKIAEASAIH